MEIENHHLATIMEGIRLPRWRSGKETNCQGRRCRFNPRVGKMPWRRAWQPTPLFLCPLYAIESKVYIFGPSVSSYPFRWPPLPTHPSQLPIRYCTLEVSQPWRGQLKLCSSPPTSPACPPRHLCYSYLNEWMTTLSKPNKSPGVILDLFPKPPLLSSYQASLVSLLRGLHSHSYCLNYLSLWLVKNLSFPIYPCPTPEHKTWETFLKVWSWPFCLLKAPPWFSMAPPANFLPSPVELFVTSSVPAMG